MDSHQYRDRYTTFDCVAATDAAAFFLPENNTLQQLKTFTQTHNDWLFGHVSYDCKNEIEGLTSSHHDKLFFPDVFFFQPHTVLLLQGNVLTIESLFEKPEDVYKNVIHSVENNVIAKHKNIQIQSRFDKQEYIDIIQKLKQHILCGDCYEINFCQEFFSEEAEVDPLELYKRLSLLSPSPFAVFYKLNDKYALCASPERFLQKKGNRLISQPIKGTVKRNLIDEVLDDELKQQLQNSEKDRTENVMITDLVRNDLSKICLRGSVKVSELFGIYSYRQVHQMITTIEGEVNKEINIADVLQATFPMGSMTGAPKRKVMQLIEQYESAKRGLYSGCIGYISPDNNWDFNVVIRSILYNETERYLSFQTGSAITFGSNAEEEYNECLLKAEAMRKAIVEHG